MVNRTIKVDELTSYNLKLADHHQQQLSQIRTYVEPFKAFGELNIYAGYDENDIFEWFIVDFIYKNLTMRLVDWDNFQPPFTPKLVGSVENPFTFGFRTTLTPPNKIGKPTAKKLDDWRTYFLAVEEEKQAYRQPRIEWDKAFRSKLEALGEMVKWNNDKSMATIEKGNLVYHINLTPSSVSQDISVSQNTSIDLETFLLMADNGIAQDNNQTSTNK